MKANLGEREIARSRPAGETSDTLRFKNGRLTLAFALIGSILAFSTSSKIESQVLKSPIEKYAEFRDAIWETDPYYKAFYGALLELNTETDRGIALVLTSFLDKTLGETLRAFLVDNDATKLLLVGFNAPLGSFSARIAACHALGLINDDESGQINIMRKVRNEFAHEIGVSFSEGRVKDLCNNLVAAERDTDTKPRDKFTRAGISMLIPLLSRPKEVIERRLVWGGWSHWRKNES